MIQPNVLVMLIVGFAMTTMTVIILGSWGFLIAAVATGAWPSDECDPASIKQAAVLGSALLLLLVVVYAWLKFGSAKRRAAGQIPDDLFKRKYAVALLAPVVVTTLAVIVLANVVAHSNICNG